jgi:hypothetical protein
MWPSDLFAPGGGACARLARDIFLQTDDIRAALAYAAEMTRERIIPQIASL